MKEFLACLFILCLCLLGDVRGQNNSALSEPIDFNSDKQLTFDVSIDPQAGAINSPRHIVLEITNNTSLVYNIDVKLELIPRALRAGRSDTLDMDCGALQLKERESVRCYLVLEYANPLGTLFDFQALLLPPGDYPVIFSVSYKPFFEESLFSTKIDTIQASVMLEPPLTSILAGGIIGSFLLALLIYILRIRRGIEWRDGLLRFLYDSILAVIVACISILIIHRVDDPSFPITLELNDFLGGAIVGFFAVKVSPFILEKFFGESVISKISDKNADPFVETYAQNANIELKRSQSGGPENIKIDSEESSLKEVAGAISTLKEHDKK